jgi:alginate O-acetyltransferase complex protein AlgI
MLFNSFEFALFLPIVFLLYWFVFNKHLKIQNLYLLTISYVFYGWWDWRFLSLIAFSSFVDFLAGIKIQDANTTKRKKLFLTISIITNLGFLGFFKYYNFFATSLKSSFEQIGITLDTFTLDIVLPVGISFYTFQTMSYTIDVYRNKLKPTKNIVDFFAYVSFFPQLVAGPIERAVNLLPQFEKRRIFSYTTAADGMRQILWGLFKKIVIADNCAKIVNQVFNDYQSYDSISLFFAATLFAFQIYGDFSGYSDIAIGTGRLFGFNLMKNFAFPYFSRDIAEFWRRWHISLSTWFKDYLYIPLGGSKGSKLKVIRNTCIIFVVSGFWHGANWTFILWGFLHFIFVLPTILFKTIKNNTSIVAENRSFPSLKELSQMILTFYLFALSMIYFRSTSIESGNNFISTIFFDFSLKMPKVFPLKEIALILVLICIEWFQRNREHGLEISNQNRIVKWLIYILILFATILFNSPNKYEFIYFQF